MIRSATSIIVFSYMFLSLIFISIVNTSSNLNDFSYEVEESSKSESSEKNNSSEEELKESKIIFGLNMKMITCQLLLSDFIDYHQKLSSIFLPEIQTPPPKLV